MKTVSTSKTQFNSISADDRQDNTAVLLADVSAILRKYITFASDAECITLSLWIMHTWAIDAADVTPYPHVSSDGPGYGKSRLARLCAELAKKAVRRVNPTAAGLFRYIDATHPTLLLDEIDAIFGVPAEQTEDIRSLLDDGFERDSVISRVLANGNVADFDVFCPKMLVGIGVNLPDSVLDRTMPIPMPKRRVDSTERMQRRVYKEECSFLSARLATWSTEEVIETLKHSRPSLPIELSDRAGDMWEPLLAIADMASDEWGVKARESAVHLHTRDVEENEDEETSTSTLSRASAVDVAIRSAFRAQRISARPFVARSGKLSEYAGKYVQPAEWGASYGRIPDTAFSEVSLTVDESSQKAFLRIPNDRWGDFCAQLRWLSRETRMTADEVKRVYKDAGRLHLDSRGKGFTQPLTMFSGERPVRAIQIDVSTGWPITWSSDNSGDVSDTTSLRLVKMNESVDETNPKDDPWHN